MLKTGVSVAVSMTVTVPSFSLLTKASGPFGFFEQPKQKQSAMMMDRRSRRGPSSFCKLFLIFTLFSIKRPQLVNLAKQARALRVCQIQLVPRHSVAVMFFPCAEQLQDRATD